MSILIDPTTNSTDGHADGHLDGHSDSTTDEIIYDYTGTSNKALARDGKVYNPLARIVHGFEGFENFGSSDTGTVGGGSSSNYVTIDGDQVITGQKSFTANSVFRKTASFNAITAKAIESDAITLTDTTPSADNSVVCKEWVVNNYATIDSVTGKFVEINGTQTILGNKTFQYGTYFKSGVSVEGNGSFSVRTSSTIDLNSENTINLSNIYGKIYINPDGHNNGGYDDATATNLTFLASNGSARFSMLSRGNEGGGIYFNSKGNFWEDDMSGEDDGHGVFLNKHGLRLMEQTSPYTDDYAVNARYVKNNFIDLTSGQTISGAKLVPTPTVSTQIANKQYVDDAIPAGTVVWYAGTTCPDGWIECNGTELSKTTYSRLYAAIGTTYGEGTGTFKVPNLVTDGRFIRSRTASVSVGTKQAWAMKAYSQYLGCYTSSLTSTSSLVYYDKDWGNKASLVSTSDTARERQFSLNMAKAFNTASEIRPVNISMMAIIKY
jgi:microcystin-dependent protein